MTKKIFNAFVFLLAAGSFTSANAECLQTVSDLNAHKVKTHWVETSADDGKPMNIYISEGKGGFSYVAKKDGAVWLQGNMSLCMSSNKIKVKLMNTKASDSVPFLARSMMSGDQTATISNNQFNLGGMGWSGNFVGK
jgi:hypothetical protein